MSVVNKIYENYNNINRMMMGKIEIESTHGGLSGSYREEIWSNFFRRIIPKKFTLDQGVVIMDSNGNFSREVDICVYDNTYTPYVFSYDDLKFIPIEAVAMVVECKSKSYTNKGLKKWSESIEKLEANPTGLARIISGISISLGVKNQKRTNPIKILVSMMESKEDSEQAVDKIFDFIMFKDSLDNQKFGVRIPDDKKEQTLGWWINRLNNFKLENKEENELRVELKEIENYKDIIKYQNGNIENTLKDLEIEGNPILSLNLQLNQLLMLINNPMMFPHFAYAKMFRENVDKIKGISEEINKSK